MSVPPPLPPRPPSRRRRFFWIGALLLALAGAGVALRPKGPPPVVVTLAPAEQRSLTQEVSATGKLQPAVEVKIFSEVAGEIIELPFREGATVRKGDLLVRIRPDYIGFQVDQAKAELASVSASAAQARVRLAKAQEDLQRSESLFAQGLIPESEITAVRTTYRQEKANTESAEANILRVQGQLRQAQDNLAKTSIYAPIDGTVTSRTAEIGERVVANSQFSGTEIMRVADLASMEVRVNINENDIVQVKVGDTARIAVDAFPGRKVRGAVKEIGSAAKTTGQNTVDEVTNFQVKIRVEEGDLAFRPGMSATVDIQTKTVENVVAVPLAALTVRSRDQLKTPAQLAADRQAAATAGRSGGAEATRAEGTERREREDRASLQRVVFRYQDGQVTLVPVETGVSDLGFIEIISGIQKGDTVVSGSYAVVARTLTDGMKVRTEEGGARARP